MNDWTIMVYMAGDNNLSDDMITQLNGIDIGIRHTMEHGSPKPATPTKISVLAEYDGEHPLAATRRIDFTYNGPGHKPIEHAYKLTLAEDNRPVSEKIAEFIKYSVRLHPADHYALVLSGHADGFQGRTLLLDENPPGVETVRQIATSIRKAIDDTAISGGKLDVIGFDACVMNSLEVVYEFKDLAKVWIGSEGSTPNYSWDYFGIASEIYDRDISTLTGADLGKIVVEKTLNYHSEYAFQGRSVDIAALDLTKIDTLVANMESSIDDLLGLFTLGIKEPADLTNLLTDVHWRAQSFMQDQNVDICDYFELLGGSLKRSSMYARNQQEINAIERACQTIANSAAGVVIARGVTGGDYQFARGLSIYMPWTYLGLAMSVANYRKLRFVGTTQIGGAWFVLILIQTLVISRGDIATVAAIYGILSESFPVGLAPMTTGSQALDISFEKVLEPLISKLSDAVGGVRDNPPRTKGDILREYFGRIRNYLPHLKP